ncbi:MAG: polysaccharide deacetylase family protein [Clostridia bacterium]|nr:polysaccharide deacetylase family protein [Clostridia bacterium]
MMKKTFKSAAALFLVFLLLVCTCACGSKPASEPEAEVVIPDGLNVGGRYLLTHSYETETTPEPSTLPETSGTEGSESPENMEDIDDDPMNIATPEPTLPPPGTDCGAKLVALTFDDGPTGDTIAFVEALNALDVKCTFFMLGYLIESYPDAVKAMVEGGHQIASHSYDHPNLKTSSQQKVDNQIFTTENLLSAIDGKDGHYIRCPYGESGDYVKSIAPAPLIYWSVDTLDWKTRNADAVYNAIVTNTYDGAIILTHDIYQSTRDGVLRAIPDLKAAGYEFVTVEELLKRRNVDIQNGTTYYDAQNEGTNYPGGIIPLTFGSFAEGMNP